MNGTQCHRIACYHELKQYPGRISALISKTYQLASLMWLLSFSFLHATYISLSHSAWSFYLFRTVPTLRYLLLCTGVGGANKKGFYWIWRWPNFECCFVVFLICLLIFCVWILILVELESVLIFAEFCVHVFR